MGFGEIQQVIVDHSRAPIFTLWRFGIGDGFLGGKVIDHREQAKTAGQMGLSVFKGTPIETIRVRMESPNVYLFDQRELRRFGFSISWIEERFELINAPTRINDQLWISGIIAGFIII